MRSDVSSPADPPKTKANSFFPCRHEVDSLALPMHLDDAAKSPTPCSKPLISPVTYMGTKTTTCSA